MIVFASGKVQDTLRISQQSPKDTLRKVSNDVHNNPAAVTGTIAPRKDPEPFTFADTTVSCNRNDILNVSFYDKNSFAKNIHTYGTDRIIINLAEKAKEVKSEQKEILISRLRTGDNLQSQQMSNDIVMIILVASVFLLTIVRSSLKNFQSLTRFFLFRGVNEAGSDAGVLFHWQTTLLNLMSFFILSLFISKAGVIENFIPSGLNGAVFWTICLALIIIALTARHFICIATGNLSGQSDVFNEYLVGIYQSYHFIALVLFVLIILSSYTFLLPARVFVIAGICVIAAMYLMRIIRLLLIFLNRNISILYLILYLCALEFLPVAVIIRYLAGPVKIG
ncbi:MAG TPA: DUF4271 domain-containing protein [Bacteroidales bacterium]|nr:DUF4271 domain-containing protein [Bacteroidales bacterium]